MSQEQASSPPIPNQEQNSPDQLPKYRERLIGDVNKFLTQTPVRVNNLGEALNYLQIQRAYVQSDQPRLAVVDSIAEPILARLRISIRPERARLKHLEGLLSGGSSPNPQDADRETRETSRRKTKKQIKGYPPLYKLDPHTFPNNRIYCGLRAGGKIAPDERGRFSDNLPSVQETRNYMTGKVYFSVEFPKLIREFKVTREVIKSALRRDLINRGGNAGGTAVLVYPGTFEQMKSQVISYIKNHPTKKIREKLPADYTPK